MTDDTAYAWSSRYLAAHDTLRSAGPLQENPDTFEDGEARRTSYLPEKEPENPHNRLELDS